MKNANKKLKGTYLNFKLQLKIHSTRFLKEKVNQFKRIFKNTNNHSNILEIQINYAKNIQVKNLKKLKKF